MVSVMEVVKVGIADMKIAAAPQTIRTSGLGSCVGVVIYDEFKKIAGLVHVMLPDSHLGKGGADLNKAKFADTGIEYLRESLLKCGCDSYRLKAKIAGGSQMFHFSSQSDVMRIGPRNAEAVKSELQRFNITLVAEDIGGSSGRTIEFDPETFILHVRTVNKGAAEI
ncbi:chemotaxis protein CheD [Falsibacillus pallidus]|uniref:Probable chemoreceptor glutamine deamidase CheD n=1 Tax=Falsibacillus pallidus TaxID=493781 RepID=A0A370GXU4_9BACI|nr:chemotaxis protein CheD [Falsibacillus pallidus]RDI47434.1 chemotaxis protein CheD [Falsibacillus pallidus]